MVLFYSSFSPVRSCSSINNEKHHLCDLPSLPAFGYVVFLCCRKLWELQAASADARSTRGSSKDGSSPPPRLCADTQLLS